MVPAIKTNTTALGDSEHKGEDVSPGSALGLAMARLLQSTPGSLHPGSGLDLVTRRGRRGWFLCSSFLGLDPSTRCPLGDGAEPWGQAQPLLVINLPEGASAGQ